MKLDLKKLIIKMLDYISGDSSWIELASGVTYKKRGGYVTVQIYKSVALSSSFSILGTLPSGYRPSDGLYFTATNSTNNTNIIGYIYTDGRIGLRIPTSSGTLQVEGMFTFPI